MSHGGTERTEGYQSKTMEVTEAPSVHRATEVVCTLFLATLCPKHLSQKLSRICRLHLRRSLCRQHLSDIAFTSVPSVTLCAYYIRRLVYHSIFQKNLFLSHLCFEFSLHNNDENTPKNTQKQPF